MNQQLFTLAAYPAIRILGMLLLGAFLGSKFPLINKPILILVISGFFLASLVIELVQFPKNPKKLLVARRLNYLNVLLIVGFIMGMFHQANSQKATKAMAFWELQKWEEVSFCGQIYEIQQATTTRYLVQIDSLLLNNVVIKTAGLNALITIPEAEIIGTGLINKILEGDRLGAVANILPNIANKSKDNTFDQQAWLRQLGVDTRWAVHTLYSHHQNKTQATITLESARAFVNQNLAYFFDKSPELESLAKAMILADKSLLTDETKALYQKTGLSHVLAVSGFHVSMLLLPLWWFMPRFWLNNKRKWTYLLLASTLMLFYVLLTGSPASVQRATLMAWFLLVGKLWHLNGPPINMLAFAAIIMIARNPVTIFDIGFQLSFAAVCSIFLVFQPIERLFSYNFRSSRWYRWIFSSLLFTFILQAAMFPLTAYYFGEHAHLGPIANLVYLPVLTFCLFPLFISAALMTPLLPQIVISNLASWLDLGYSYLAQFLVWLSHLPIATNEVKPPSIVLLAAFLCLIVSLNFWANPRVRWRSICLALLCFNLDMLF